MCTMRGAGATPAQLTRARRCGSGRGAKPIPSWPRSLLPTENTAPSSSSSSENALPAATITIAVALVKGSPSGDSTGGGASSFASVPMPSWPWSLRPDASTRPSAVRNSECEPAWLVATCAISRPHGTSCGTRL